MKKRMREQKNKTERRMRRKRRRTAVCAGVLLALGLVALAVGVWIERTTERLFPEELLTVDTRGRSPRFYAYDFSDREARVGERREITAEVYAGRRTEIVREDEIPPHVKAAFVAIEDKRFYTHRGVDWRRTLAAMANDLLGFSDGFGGSTITQQLVKNLTGNRELRWRRKLQEILWARDLERRMEKDEILTFYLNIISFADRCEGIGSAAAHYFGKTVSELTAAESACLAAVINNPTYYHPLRQPAHNQARRRLILEQMHGQGYLNDEAYREALEEELSFVTAEGESSVDSWYVDMVIEDLLRDLEKERHMSREEASRLIYYGGLSIDLAVDLEVQRQVEEYYSRSIRLPKDESGRSAQSAMIVIDPHTGDILGVAGAAGEKTGNRLQNLATEACRSPGSAIKPISVYAPALSRGLIHWASVYDDVPVRLEEGGRAWPRNADGVYRGLTTVAYAVAHSTNTVAVRVLEELGLEESFRTARERFHLQSLRRDSEVDDCTASALAMGQLHYGLTLRELTAAYTVFADGGLYHPWHSYYRVCDPTGRVLLSSPDRAERVLTAAEAAVMTKLLEGVVESGTSSAVTLARTVACAGKTGTTSNDADRWFVGYTSTLLCGVWCGYEYPAPLSGRNIATGIWNEVMVRLTQLRGGARSFSLPEGVVQLRYCLDSGELPDEACAKDPRGERTALGWFCEDRIPTELCHTHVLCRYDAHGGGVDHGFCPEEELSEVALIRVERHFPREVVVRDAAYVLREDPATLPPNPNRSEAYFGSAPEGSWGRAPQDPPYNASCPLHQGLDASWWEDYAERLKERME